MRIRTRLFFTMLLATGLVVAGVYGFSRLAFEVGFVEYLRTQEERKTEAVAARFESWFAENGSWDALVADRRAFRALVYQGVMASHRRYVEEDDANYDGDHGDDDNDDDHHEHRYEHKDRHVNLDFGPGREPGRDSFRRAPNLRVLLLGPDKQILVGRYRDRSELELTELRHKDRVVGYLAVVSVRRFSDHLDERFAHGLDRTFLLIALFAVLVSGLLAFPLAHRFGEPIRALQQAARKLAGGDYSVRTAQEAGSRRKDEIARLSVDFDDLAAALERTEQQRRRWVADVSHELRTPLTVLRGEIEALQDGVREVTPQTLSSLQAEVIHLGRLVDDLYELSMSDQGALSYHKTDVDAAMVLRQCLDGLADEFGQADVRLETGTLEQSAVPVFADSGRLAQLFTNLLSNSYRYTDPGGLLRISVKQDRQAGSASWVFEDSGPGVAEADLAHLFERFYRVENSRNRATGGAGLGLAISANIVEAHGGRIHAEASSLGGLAVHLELPLSKV